mgnify:CR=1 FL=1
MKTYRVYNTGHETSAAFRSPEATAEKAVLRLKASMTGPVSHERTRARRTYRRIALALTLGGTCCECTGWGDVEYIAKSTM